LLRQKMSRNDPMHAVAGPLEHREFVRDLVGNEGMLAGASMAAATPAYTARKYVDEKFAENGALGNPLLYLLYAKAKANGMLGRPRSPASWDEIFAGYEGLFSGLKDRAATPPKAQQDTYAQAI
jgi:hypothetical protein